MSETAPRVFQLREVTTRLRSILLPATQREFWVRAQFVPDRGRRAGGHCYGHLVEHDGGGNEVAKLRVCIWKRDLERIEAGLKQRGEQGCAPLRNGGEICARCAVRFHDVYGLSLSIFDVDPDFGESRLDRNRRRILETLQREGLLEKNKLLRLSAAPLRIGLLTASGSAAYTDFHRTLMVSQFGFEIVHVAAVMQGAGCAASVLAAMQQLSAQPLDLICVIRGGGSPVDLAWLDHEELARAIAECPVPVWTGIGHEIDMGVLDFVAHTSHKTPTAAAEALVARIRELYDRLVLAAERLQEACQRRLDLADRTLKVATNGLRHGSRKQLEIQSERFNSQVSRLETALAEQSSRFDQKLQRNGTRLRERTRSFMEGSGVKLARAAERLQTGSVVRLDSSREKLQRSATGLVEGSRKHRQLFEERLSGRIGRLRGIAERLLEATARSQGARVARLILASKNRHSAAMQSLQWRRKSAGRVLQALDLSERNLAGRVARLRPTRFEAVHQTAADRLTEKHKRLESLSPERLLEKGYSITRTIDGEIVRSVADVGAGTVLLTRLKDGVLTSEINSIEGQSNG